jgi:hypothetical protein
MAAFFPGIYTLELNKKDLNTEYFFSAGHERMNTW